MTSDEMINTTIAFHVSRGRPSDCPLILWLAAQRGRSAQDVRAEMVQRDDWSPTNSLEGIAAAGRLAGDERAAAQALYAAHLTRVGEAKHKSFTLAFLAGRRDLIDPAILAGLESWAQS